MEAPVCDENGIKTALAQVIDPELGINIVDLGLIHEIRIEGDSIGVDLMATSAACPLGGFLTATAEQRLRAAYPSLRHVTVTLRRDLRWEKSRMSEQARKKLSFGGR